MRDTPSPQVAAPARRSWARLLFGLAFLAALAILLGPCQSASSPAQRAPQSLLVPPGAGP